MAMNNSSFERQEGRKVLIDSKGNKTYAAMPPRTPTTAKARQPFGGEANAANRKSFEEADIKGKKSGGTVKYARGGAVKKPGKGRYC
jgi:hypothetical protein